jgi:hypothetical protein
MSSGGRARNRFTLNGMLAHMRVPTRPLQQRVHAPLVRLDSEVVNPLQAVKDACLRSGNGVSPMMGVDGLSERRPLEELMELPVTCE